MLKYLSVTAVAALLAISTSFANQTTARVTIPVDKTPASNGRLMFTSYCAPCHGADGRGQGPAAANHGKFPEAHVAAILRFGAGVPAHGSAEMPVWGPILGKMNQTNVQEKELRISNLGRYLESIQKQ